MSLISGLVQQVGRALLNDGDSGESFSQGRDGALLTMDQYNRWLRAGYVWNFTKDVAGDLATIENNTAIDLAEPFLRTTVNAGFTMVPLHIEVQPAVVWETGDEFILYTSDTDTYSAGGDALQVQNAAQSNSLVPKFQTAPFSNSFDGDAALTEGAVTNSRVIHAGHHLTGGLHLPYEYSAMPGSGRPYVTIQGPGSLCLMLARTTTTVEALFSMTIAALPEGEVF